LTPKKSKIGTRAHWPKRQRFDPTTMHYTTIDPPNIKDSNPRPCTIPPLTPKGALHHHWPPQSQRFEPTTMHYTTIDEPEKTKIRTQDHALLYTTIDNLHRHSTGQFPRRH
jgi:hypothetical protein